MTCRLALLLLCLLATPAFALEYRSAAEPAILYNAPATKAARLLILARYTPVEVVVSVVGWVKVRDAKGNLAWVEAKALSSARTVQVRVDRAQVHAEANDQSPRIFEAEQDVALELIEAGPAGWARVKHRDGQTGYVRVAQIWGL